MVHSRPQLAWYVLWGTMLGIAAGNTLAHRPVFTGNVGFLVSLLLACAAFLQILSGRTRLSGKEGRLAATLLVCFVIAQTAQWLRSMKPASPYRGFDFSAYYLAAKVLPEVPQHDLYALPLEADGRASLNKESPAGSILRAEAEREHLPWSTPLLYPPLLPVLVTPLALLSFPAALIAWELLSTALVFGSVLLALDLGGVRLNPPLASILGVGVFSYAPFADGLFVGQIGPLMLFLLTAGVSLLRKRRDAASAFAFAVATLIKLTPLMVLPVLVIHRRWRWAAAYAGWMAALIVFSAAQVGDGWHAGWALYLEFFRQVLPRIAAGVPVGANASVSAWVQEFFLGYVPRWPDAPAAVPVAAQFAGRAASLLAYAAVLACVWRRRAARSQPRDIVHDLILMVLLGLAVSPVSWWHHYTLALLPFVYLWCRVPGSSDRSLLLLFLAVGTNLVGFILTETSVPALQLALAGVTPALTLAIVFRELSSHAGAVSHGAAGGLGGSPRLAGWWFAERSVNPLVHEPPIQTRTTFVNKLRLR